VEQIFSSDIRAEVNQGLDVFLSPNADNFIGVIHVETFGLHQQPVEPDNGDTAFLRGLSNRFSSLRGHVEHRVRQRERRNLDPS